MEYRSMRLNDYGNSSVSGSGSCSSTDPLIYNVLHGKYPTPVLNTSQEFEIALNLIPAMEQIQIKSNLNLALVLDRSGSMCGENIRNLRNAAKLIVDIMSSYDHLTVVVYDCSSEIIIHNQQVTNPNDIKRKIDNIDDGGNTYAGPAIEKAIREIKKTKNGNLINRIIMLTDGHDHDESHCRKAASLCGEQKIPITALGLGDNWNEKLLDEIAKISGGQVDWIDNPQKITQFFKGQVTQMQNIVVTDCQMSFKTVLDFEIENVWRLKPMIEKLRGQISNRNFRYNLGSIEKDGQVIYICGTVPAKPQGDFRMMWGNLEFYIAGEPHSVPLEVFFKFVYGTEPMIHPQMADISGLVNMLDCYQKSLKHSKSGDRALATQLITDAAEYGTRLLKTGGLPDSAKEIVKGIEEEVANLTKHGTFSENATKKMFRTQHLGSLERI